MICLAFRFVFAAAILWVACASAQAEVRVALVIGNGAYQNVPRLLNPENDANDVAAALKRDGFDTIFATDLNKDQMDEATIKFAKAARTADVAMFYYSGHALQFAGVNYLAPVDAKLTDEADLRRFVRVDEIVGDLQQAKNLRILVLDACRDNPLADQLRRSIGATRALPLQGGLAKMDTPLGMIVSFSTQAGTEADDGNGRNSPYTAAFLKEIEQQDEIGTIFRRVSSDVYEATSHRQLPELSLSLIGEFYLRGKLSLSTSNAVDACAGAVEHWKSADALGTKSALEDHLARFPNCQFAALARERINALAPSTPVTTAPATPAPRQSCNNPNALGIARTVEIDTTGGPGFGFQQFKDMDFLRDHEVVLTFEDGPWTDNTPMVLKALAQECTTGIFFEIGKHATYYPEISRQVYAAGHTVGTHTWSHADLTNKSLTDDQRKSEIEKGISAVKWALGGISPAPFFRFPNLRPTPEMVTYLGTRDIAIFSTDLDSFDFKAKSAKQVEDVIFQKLSRQGKGIILMHDFHKHTAEALPAILQRLKVEGFKVVAMRAKTSVQSLPQYDKELTEEAMLPASSSSSNVVTEVSK
jgi:peptidoglycan/xylan/chitin deacetylase (PgdA/CDA1 family)